jgi:hypothetical protein
MELRGIIFYVHCSLFVPLFASLKLTGYLSLKYLIGSQAFET